MALCSGPCAGEMAERLKAHAWKACVRESVPRVRIPVSPPGAGAFCGNIRSLWNRPLISPPIRCWKAGRLKPTGVWTQLAWLQLGMRIDAAYNVLALDDGSRTLLPYRGRPISGSEAVRRLPEAGLDAIGALQQLRETAGSRNYSVAKSCEEFVCRLDRLWFSPRVSPLVRGEELTLQARPFAGDAPVLSFSAAVLVPVPPIVCKSTSRPPPRC